MRFENLLAPRTRVMGASAIREILKVVAQPGMISLAGGIPAPESFPLELMGMLTETVLSRFGATALQYDRTEGFAPLQAALVDLLAARGTAPTVTRVPTPGRTFESRTALAGFVRRQLWIDPAGPSEARFQAALDELAVTDDTGWLIAGRGPNEVGLVEWHP